MKIILAAIAAMTLAGCASDYGKYAEIQMAHEAAQAERWKAMGKIAETGDTTTKVAAMFALQDQGSGASRMIAAPKSASDNIREWIGILIPLLIQGYGIHANTQMGMRQSDNATALGVSTNQAFVGMASQIQAPAANLNLSGNGTIGSGSYSTDTHAVTNSYNPAPITTDNSNQNNPVTYPAAVVP